MQGTSHSLPTTPDGQKASQTTNRPSSTGPNRQAPERKPSAARVQLFTDEDLEVLDTKKVKSVHWGVDNTQADGSPISFWNVEHGTVRKLPSESAAEYHANRDNVIQDGYNSLIADIRSENPDAPLDYLSYSPSGTTANLMSQAFGLPYNTSLASRPDGSRSQQTRQDHTGRDQYFTSSPRLQTNAARGGSNQDDSQDVSLLSSIAVPFELRPKMYDDSVLTEENTVTGESEAEEQFQIGTQTNQRRQVEHFDSNESKQRRSEILKHDHHGEPEISSADAPRRNVDALQLSSQGHKLHHSDGAAQLLALRRTHSDLTGQALVSSRLHPDLAADLRPRARSQDLLLLESQKLRPSDLGSFEQQQKIPVAEKFEAPQKDSTLTGDPREERQPRAVTSESTYEGRIERPPRSASQPAIVNSVVDSLPVNTTKTPMEAHAHVPSVETSSSSSNVAIQNLQQMRSHLHSMLDMTKKAFPGKAEFDETGDAGQEVFAGLVDVYQDDTFSSGGSFPPVSFKSLSEIEGVVGSGFVHPSGSHSSASASLNNSSIPAEVQLYKEQLQRERYRRKHCEKQITELQSKMLELQQQLAVAVSTDRKKETMIEHLDKALAKVMDGWKKKDAEKAATVKKLEEDNRMLKYKCEHQTENIVKLQSEVNDSMERLRAESRRASEADQHARLVVEQQTQSGEETRRLIDKERSMRVEMETERNEAVETKEKLLADYNDLQQNFENDKEHWEEKESEYLHKIDEITNNHMKCMDQEKEKREKLDETLGATQEVLTAAQKEMHNLKIQLDTTTREKESLKVEMGLLEARLENEKRKLESDLKSEFEKETTERLEEAHSRQMAAEEELRGRHRKQLYELQQRHTAETEEQLQQYQQDVRRRDDKLSRQALSFEEKATEMKTEMDSMKSYVKKLESQRLEMTHKLQSMMQTHCNEALRLLQIGSSSSAVSSSTTQAPRLDFKQPDLAGKSIYSTSPSRHQATTYTTSQYLGGFAQQSSSTSTFASAKSSEYQPHSDPSSSSLAATYSVSATAAQLQVQDDDGQSYTRNGESESRATYNNVSIQRLANRKETDQFIPDVTHVSHVNGSGLSVADPVRFQAPTLSYAVAQTFQMQPQPRPASFHQTNQMPQSMVSPTDLQPSAGNTQTRTSKEYDQPTGHFKNTPASLIPSQGTANMDFLQTLLSFSQRDSNSQQTYPSTESSSRPTGFAVSESQAPAHPNPRFLEALAEEADVQEQMRMRDFFDSSLQHEYSRLSSDGATDATGADQLSFRSEYQDSDGISFSREHSAHGAGGQPADTRRVEEQGGGGMGFRSSADAPATFQNSAPSVPEKIHIHEERQSELQNYIKMLLQKSPNSPENPQMVPTNTPADPERPSGHFQTATSSIMDSDPSVMVFSPTSALETPPKSAFRQVAVGGAQVFHGASADSGDSASLAGHQGVLSPQQVGEISRLLGLYRPGPEGSSNHPSAGTTPPMTELLTYLKDLKPESGSLEARGGLEQEAPTRDVPSTATTAVKRNLSPSFSETVLKQAPKASPPSSHGSPVSSRKNARRQGMKPNATKASQPQTKPPPKLCTTSGKTTTAAAAKKTDKKVTSSKAKQGVWK